MTDPTAPAVGESGAAKGARPSLDVVLMRVAKAWAERSTCSRSKVGAAIAVDSRTIASGYNGVPSGERHCDHSCDCGAAAQREFWLAKNGYLPSIGGLEHDRLCRSLVPCGRAIHAEANALYFAERYGVPVKGATLYTTMAPCLACAILIIRYGIEHVFVGSWYRNMRGVEYLRDKGVTVVWLSLTAV